MNRSLLCRAALAGCAALLTAVIVPAHAQAAAGNASQQASRTYIADGLSLGGPALYRPACDQRYYCSLSDNEFLYRMRWSQWSATRAAGTGTYLLNDCTPNCAEGRFSSVPVVVTFTDPVRACLGKSVRWYWTKATFRFTHGLPAVFRVAGAITNPFDFTGLAAAARASCR